MKIGLVDVTTTLSYGGMQTAVAELAVALADQGHAVTIYSGTGPITPNLRGRAVSLKTFDYTPRQRFWNLGTRFRKFAERLSFARHARSAVVADAPDWVILVKPLDFFWPWMMPAGCATRFAYLSGGTDFLRFDRKLAARVPVLTACSHFNAWQNYAHFKRQVHTVYLGVDVTQFRPAARDVALRAQWGVAGHEVLFAFAGRLVGWKGVHLAVRALAQPALANAPVKLLIIGGGPAEASLRALAAELGVTARVIFHGPSAHADLPRVYASADAGVFPSIGDEAFGITIAEAMACGLPVVASYNGGIPEVVGNEGRCGVLTALGDVADLARGMAELARATEQRNAMGLAARERVERLYTWAHVAERLLHALSAAQ